MISWNGSCAPSIAVSNEGTNSSENTQNIAPLRNLVQIPARGFQNEFNLGVKWRGLQRHVRNRGVGRSNDRVSMPWNREDDAPIGSVRHQNRAVAGKEGTVEYKVNSLAGRYEWSSRRVRHLANRVAEWSGSVYYNIRADREFAIRLDVSCRSLVHKSVRIFVQSRYLNIVDDCGAMIRRRLHEIYQETCVIELAIVVNHPSSQAVLLNGWQSRKSLFACQELR